jgi:hypothetical protein
MDLIYTHHMLIVQQRSQLESAWGIRRNSGTEHLGESRVLVVRLCLSPLIAVPRFIPSSGIND